MFAQNSHEVPRTVINIPGYKVQRVLGKGGMATVYLAIQESFERDVALKVMSPNLSEDPKFSERFVREAKIVSRLMHPNIVTVYDVGVQNGHHYLSMEYIPGKDLKTKRRFMTAKQCIRVIKEVAAALDYASKKGYVHRDVKPENIMLHEEDGRAILMDFGIACMEDTASGMTQTGTAIGTPHYMSPEQAKGRQVDSRSDIYSLGVVFYLCLTGHVPFDADSAVAVGIKHVSEAVPRLPKYLLLLQPIIDKVLAKDPSERYQTGLELIAAINQISDQDFEAIDILATKKTIARIDTKDTESATVVSGSVKTIPSVQDQTRMTASTKTSAPTRSVTQSSTNTNGGAAKAALRKKTATNAANKRHTTATTAPIRATTGATNSSTKTSMAATELLTVDEDDRRDREIENPFPKQHRLWPWMLVASLLVVVFGSYYFREQLPPPVQNVVEATSQKIFVWSDQIFGTSLQSPPAPNAVVNNAGSSASTADAITSLPAGNNNASDNSVTGGVENFGSAGETPVLTAEPTAVDPNLVKTPSLSERLAAGDLSVTEELAQSYREVLSREPNNQNAIFGLANIKRIHFDAIRLALEPRDIETAAPYFSSLEKNFTDIAADETYQKLLQRKQNAVTAQEHIDKGREYLEKNNLTSPKGSNAFEAFKAALNIDVGNPLAEQGVKDVVARFVELADMEFKAGNFQKTQQYADSGLAIESKDEALLKLRQDAQKQQQLEQNIADVMLKAKRAVADGNLVTPAGDNAFDYYQRLRTLGRASAANNGIAEVQNLVVQAVEKNINTNQFDVAKQLLVHAKEKYPANETLLGLEVSLEQAVRADFEASQPKILSILVSGQPTQELNQVQRENISLQRTAHVGFEYKNFVGDTSVVQVILYDGTRTHEIAQKSVIVNGAEGVKFFQIDRPVEGFAEGVYNIDLMLQGNNLRTLAFKVNHSASAATN